MSANNSRDGSPHIKRKKRKNHKTPAPDDSWGPLYFIIPVKQDRLFNLHTGFVLLIGVEFHYPLYNDFNKVIMKNMQNAQKEKVRN